MQYSDREYIVNKIVSGISICSYNNIPVIVAEPSPIDKVRANAIYAKEFRSAELLGVRKEEDLLSILMKTGEWSKAEEDRLSKIPKEIEDIKVDIYNNFYNYKKQDGIKKTLDSLKHMEVELLRRRETYKSSTCEGIALSAKNRFLICAGAKTLDGTRFFAGSIDDYDNDSIDLFIQDYFYQKIDDSVIREVSKHEPWRSIWSAGKYEGAIFGTPSSLLSQEQRMIIIWSRIYDSIHESPECPPDVVLNDDDCLDGWLIVNARKREQERMSEHGYKPGDKFAKHDEVFIMVDDDADSIKRVESMNSPSALFRKQQRMTALAKTGSVEEQNMPDSQDRMRKEMVQLMQQKIHGNKRKK